MRLDVIRTELSRVSTIGDLLIDGKFFCNTLEDIVRPTGEKVYGKTAIPSGTYKVIIDKSTRFKRFMPHILDVPGFDGIRIHSGNTAENTEGCILLGIHKVADFVGNSKTTFDKFFPILEDGLKSGEVFITIVNKF